MTGHYWERALQKRVFDQPLGRKIPKADALSTNNFRILKIFLTQLPSENPFTVHIVRFLEQWTTSKRKRIFHTPHRIFHHTSSCLVLCFNSEDRALIDSTRSFIIGLASKITFLVSLIFAVIAADKWTCGKAFRIPALTILDSQGERFNERKNSEQCARSVRRWG